MLLGRRAGLAPRRSPRISAFWRFVIRRALVVPAQILFVLLLLFLVVVYPTTIHHHRAPPGFGNLLTDFYQLVGNDLVGNWGTSNLEAYPGVSWAQLYVYALPNSIELGAISLGLAAAIAYPIGLVTGWSRRPGADLPGRFGSLVLAYVPPMVIGTLVLSAIFFDFYRTFHDLPDNGLLPSPTWIQNTYGTIPRWIVNDQFTRPTGLSIVDGTLHHAWAFVEISLIKTLIQALVIALVFVAVFLRPIRSAVFQASQERYIVGARSRGVPERVLLWKHTARRVRPTLLMAFALAIPTFLAIQFTVEAVFADYGIGWLTFLILTGDGVGGLVPIQAMILLIAILILVALFVLDVLAFRLDPREVRGT